MNSKYVNSLIKFIQKTKSNTTYGECPLSNWNTHIRITKRDCTGIHCTGCIFNKPITIDLIRDPKDE